MLEREERQRGSAAQAGYLRDLSDFLLRMEPEGQPSKKRPNFGSLYLLLSSYDG